MVRFMHYKWLYFLISALVIVPGVISLLLFGLKPSIDFTGGTLWEIRVSSAQSQVNSGSIQKVFGDGGFSAEVQLSGTNQFLISTAPLNSAQRAALTQKLKSLVGTFTETRFETLGPRLGSELLSKAVVAVILAMLLILAYVAYRFRNFLFGVSAILAVFHDTLVLLGVFSLLGHFFGVEVDTLYVTAVLTTISFSVHDTIVVFDRIREIRRRVDISLEAAIDQAVGETLVRSLNNSLTVIFMLIALLVLGGDSLRYFVLALLVGAITGTYSSTFNAAPLLVVLSNLRKKKS